MTVQVVVKTEGNQQPVAVVRSGFLYLEGRNELSGSIFAVKGDGVFPSSYRSLEDVLSSAQHSHPFYDGDSAQLSFSFASGD